MTGKVVKRVAVIGAGPAGAITIDALAQEKKFDTIRVFERREKAGGVWVYDADQRPRIPSLRDIINQTADKPIELPSVLPARTPKDPIKNGHNNRYSYTPMHEHLESNIPAPVMSFTQEPFPSERTALSVERFGSASPYRHREVVRKWIESLIQRNGYEKFVQYNTTVEFAEKVGTEWVLTLRRSSPNEEDDFWWQETFDALVVANGHYTIPYIPDIPGLVEAEDRFPGAIEHSKSYRRPASYSNKNVVVVGASVSATDIIRDLVSVAKKPVYAALRGPHAVFGYKAFEHPNIVIKPSIIRVETGDTITAHFSDGTKLEKVDHIIFGTGYSFSLPFLPSVKISNRRLDGFYLHVWKQGDPTLALVGGVSGGFTFRVFEWQAVAIARVLAGRGNLPALEVQQKWEKDRLALRGEGVPFYKIAPDFEEYFTALRNIAGKPEAGSPGRILPEFDPKWLDIFGEGIQAKLTLWKREADVVNDTNITGVAQLRAKL